MSKQRVSVRFVVGLWELHVVPGSYPLVVPSPDFRIVSGHETQSIFIAYLRGLRLELRMPSHAYSHCSIGDALLVNILTSQAHTTRKHS